MFALNNMNKYFISLLSCLPLFSFAQQDLLSMATTTDTVKKHEKALSAFMTTKIINAQSTETVKRHCLDFRITHRFGNIAPESGGGVHELYGWDDISDVRISFDYGLTDKITIGFGRSKIDENLDFTLKWKLLEQTTDSYVPVSVTLYENAALTPMLTSSLYDGTTDSVYRFSDRMSYVSQLIIARRLNRSFSFEILPTYQHRNFVKAGINPENNAQDQNDLFAIGAGFRMKVTKRMAIIADYFHVFSAYRTNNTAIPYYDPLAVGFEIETGGHVFDLNFTNASGIIENNFLPYTTDSWTKGGIKFGFNISRIFVL
jgi:hypothetical protein